MCCVGPGPADFVVLLQGLHVVGMSLCGLSEGGGGGVFVMDWKWKEWDEDRRKVGQREGGAECLLRLRWCLLQWERKDLVRCCCAAALLLLLLLGHCCG